MSTKSEGELLELLIELNNDNSSPHILNDVKLKLASLKQNFLDLLKTPPRNENSKKIVEGKKVTLPKGEATLTRDQVQVVLKLSEDFGLDEIKGVELLVAAYDEAGQRGRHSIELESSMLVQLQLSAGLFLRRRTVLLNALSCLTKIGASTLGYSVDVIEEVQKYLKELMSKGFRKRMIDLIAELGRPEPTGIGGANAERYVLDEMRNLESRAEIIQGQRLLLSRCLLLSSSIYHFTSQEVRGLFSLVKETFENYDNTGEASYMKIAYTLLFAATNFTADEVFAIEKGEQSILERDTAFQREIGQQMLNVSPTSYKSAGMTVLMFFWGILLRKQEEKVGTLNTDDKRIAEKCWETPLLEEAFQFLDKIILQNISFQTENFDFSILCLSGLSKVLGMFYNLASGKDLIKGWKDESTGGPRGESCFNSFLRLVGHVHRTLPELNGDKQLWIFCHFLGQSLTQPNLVNVFFEMVSDLVTTEERARKAYALLDGGSVLGFSWKLLPESLQYYDRQLQGSYVRAGLEAIPDHHVLLIHSFVKFLGKIISVGKANEVCQWFPDVEYLFLLLSSPKAPTELKGVLRAAISAWILKKGVPGLQSAQSLLQKYEIPLYGHLNPYESQSYTLDQELSLVEVSKGTYNSTISYLELQNVFIELRVDHSDQWQMYEKLCHFVKNFILLKLGTLRFNDMAQKWELVGAALKQLQLLLNLYNGGDVLIPALDASQPQQSRVHPGKLIVKEILSGQELSTAFMEILCCGPQTLLSEKASSLVGLEHERAIVSAWDLFSSVLEKEKLSRGSEPRAFALDSLLGHSQVWVGSLLNFVGYSSNHGICLKALSFLDYLSDTIPDLVELLMSQGKLKSLRKSFVNCLTLVGKSPELGNGTYSVALAAVEILLKGLSKQSMNISHTLLGFSLMDGEIEDARVIVVLLDFVRHWENGDGQLSNLYEKCLELLHILSSSQMTREAFHGFIHFPTSASHSFNVLLNDVSEEVLPYDDSSGPDISTLHLAASMLRKRGWLFRLVASNFHHAEVQSEAPTCPPCLAWIHNLLKINHNQRHMPGDDSELIFILDNLVFLPKYSSFQPSPSLVRGLNDLGFKGDGFQCPKTFALKLEADENCPEIDSRALLKAWRSRKMGVNRSRSPSDFFELSKWINHQNAMAKLREAQLLAVTGWSQLAQILVVEGVDHCLTVRDKLLVLKDLLDPILEVLVSPELDSSLLKPLARVVCAILLKVKLLTGQQYDPSSAEGESVEQLHKVCLGFVAPALPKVLQALLKQGCKPADRPEMYTALSWMLHFVQRGMEILEEEAKNLRKGEDKELEAEHAGVTWKISSSLNALWENERKLAELLAVDATYGEIAHTSKIWMLMASLVQILDKDSREEPGPFVAALETSGTIRIAVDSVSNLNLDSIQTGSFPLYYAQLSFLESLAISRHHQLVEILARSSFLKTLASSSLISTLKLLFGSSPLSLHPQWSKDNLFKFLRHFFDLLYALVSFLCALNPQDLSRIGMWVTVLWDELGELSVSHADFFSSFLLIPVAFSKLPTIPHMEQLMSLFKTVAGFCAKALTNEKLKVKNAALESSLRGLISSAFLEDVQLRRIAYLRGELSSSLWKGRLEEADQLEVKCNLLDYLLATLTHSGFTKKSSTGSPQNVVNFPLEPGNLTVLIEASIAAYKKVKQERNELLQLRESILASYDEHLICTIFSRFRLAEAPLYVHGETERKTFAIKIIDAHIHLIQERLLCSHKAILEKVVGVTAYPKQLGKFLTKDETPRELGRREKLAVEQMLFKLIQENPDDEWKTLTYLLGFLRSSST